MKRLSLIAFLLFIAATHGLGQDADSLATLDRYVGSWGGYSSKTRNIAGTVDSNNRYMGVTVQKVATDAIELEGDVWAAKASLRYDKDSADYLLSWSAEGYPSVADLPVQFSQPDGFTGSKTMTCDGEPCKTEATIQDREGGGFEWTLIVWQGNIKSRLCLRLGKEE